MAYGDFKNFLRRTASDKVLRDKAFNIAKNPKQDRYQKSLTSMVYRFFGKKSSGAAAKRELMLNQQLVGELHKRTITKT